MKVFCSEGCMCDRHKNGELNHRWTGDEATKDALHQRLYAYHGRAKEYKCVDCDEQATKHALNFWARSVMPAKSSLENEWRCGID